MHIPHRALLCLILAGTVALAATARGEWIWIEGEKPVSQSMHRHPWWYDQVKRENFSGGDFISNFDKDNPGEAEYRFDGKAGGTFDFWVRANPLMARLSYALNRGPDTAIDLNREKRGETNVAADGKPDLRFIAWCHVGPVTLRKGENTIRFRMTSENNHHGYLDCFVFSNESFQPRGLLKPDQIAATAASSNNGWFTFDPPPDPFHAQNAIDLRSLNESYAGEHGRIGVKDGHFIRTGDGVPLRFWAVNGPPPDLSAEDLRRCARTLAKHGVNLVRIHGGYFNARGEVDMEKVRRAIRIVEAMKREGIYTHFSIYFPLWLTPAPDTPWLRGYDGKSHPFAALMFNPDFQAKYRQWWAALLTTQNPDTGRTLAGDPAVASLEIQNEDSFFFWTFASKTIPDAQMIILEKQFGDWLAKRYGSPDAALARWHGKPETRDAPKEGRVAFRPLWNLFTEKSLRDQDTARFLLDTQSRFYQDTRTYLRGLGFAGPVTASNWITASPEILGPLEKLSYTGCDFIDRHGYFDCRQRGENAEWSVRDGHTFSDRSALRFDPELPGKPRVFNHPAMDPHYNGLPSMISETTWNRPNRFRGEAPLYYAAYGALQDSDAIIHFALDSGTWSVKPGYFMQPWTIMTPAMAGQFPAAALIYRRGLVATGPLVAEVNLNRESLLALKGTPLPQDSAPDELRLKDMPSTASPDSAARIDPLAHYTGRSAVKFTDQPTTVKTADLSKLIRHNERTVASATGQLRLDYGKGTLTIDAPCAQGLSGMLDLAGPTDTHDLSLSSNMAPGHIIAVSLDNRPLATSSRILLQVMSEEQTSGFLTEPAGDGTKRIVSIGTDPWQIRDLQGTVRFKRPDAAALRVTALDANGDPLRPAGNAAGIRLFPDTIYYLIAK